MELLFRSILKNFIRLNVANQLLKRFDFNLNSFECLKPIDLETVMKKRTNVLLDIFKDFPIFILQTESEFRELNIE